MVLTEASIQTTPDRERFFKDLYENAFPAVAKFVSHRKGTFEDAKDIFQDALIIFYEKLQEDRFVARVSDKAYLLGIAKHLWLKKYGHDRSLISLNNFEAEITLPDDYLPTAESGQLLKLLERTGKKCMELLQSFYFTKESLSNITRTFGYSSIHSATVQKFKCLEKVRDKVKEKSLDYECFTE